jgi:hypothetical protein
VPPFELHRHARCRRGAARARAAPAAAPAAARATAAAARAAAVAARAAVAVAPRVSAVSAPYAPSGLSGVVKKPSNSSRCTLHSSVIASLRSASPIAIGRSLPLSLSLSLS